MGMTDRDRKLLAIFAGIILLGGYWFLILGKKRSAVADAQSAKVSAQAQLDDAIAKESAGKAEKKHYPVSYSRVLRMGKAIPVNADFPSLLVQVNDIADETHVQFSSLTTTDGSATGTPAGPTGTTTCEAQAGSDGASASTSTGGATGASAAVVQPSAAVSGIGKTINTAKAGAATGSKDANRASASNTDIAAKCASSPTLTDVTAVASGLRLSTFNFTFEGSFYSLHNVFDGLLNMVRTNNGHIKVTGRLLQINNFNIQIKTFPVLEATVEMTGYALPVGSTITAGATASGPAGSAEGAAVTTAAPAGGASTPPPATILGGK
jgi:hypothetical protein